MNRMITTIAAGLMSIGVWAEVMTEGAKVGEWTQDWDAAVALSQEKDIPIFALFTGSDWCQYCIKLHDRVFSKEGWTSWAKDNVVLVYIDFPKDESRVPEAYRERNQELSDRYGVQGYPSCILLSVEDQEMRMIFGYSDSDTAESFAKDVEDFLPLARRGGLQAILNEKEWSQYQEAKEKYAKAKTRLEEGLLALKAKVEKMRDEGKEMAEVRQWLRSEADELDRVDNARQAAHRVMMALLKRAQKKAASGGAQ